MRLPSDIIEHARSIGCRFIQVYVHGGEFQNMGCNVIVDGGNDTLRYNIYKWVMNSTEYEGQYEYAYTYTFSLTENTVKLTGYEVKRDELPAD